MRFAYADPPYPGMAYFYPEKTEVNHAELVDRLAREYPDGWALSTASTTLQRVLPLCPEDVRIMAWVKPFASFKPGVHVAYAWEPVIVRGGRKGTREQLTVRDWVSTNITLERGVVGAKPDAFYIWLIEVLNAEPDDTIDDLFPGTAGLERVRRQGRLSLQNTETTRKLRGMSEMQLPDLLGVPERIDGNLISPRRAPRLHQSADFPPHPEPPEA